MKEFFKHLKLYLTSSMYRYYISLYKEKQIINMLREECIYNQQLKVMTQYGITPKEYETYNNR